MVEKNNIQKVLAFFFDNPTTELHLRELSRRLSLSMPTIVSVTRKLSKKNLIITNRGIALTTVKGNLENVNFTRLKRIHNIESLYTSGIVDYLNQEFRTPNAIICFGSYSRGDDIETSDIDIAIISGQKKEISLEKFEKALNRTISIHHVTLDRVSNEFKSNLYSGIVLEGAL